MATLWRLIWLTKYSALDVDGGASIWAVPVDVPSELSLLSGQLMIVGADGDEKAPGELSRSAAFRSCRSSSNSIATSFID